MLRYPFCQSFRGIKLGHEKETPALTPLLVLLQCFQHLVAFKLAAEAEDSASEGYDSWCVWGISFRLEDAPGKRL